MSKILKEEPDRGGPICGYQISAGRMSDEFCGERKVPGLFFCREHHDWVAMDAVNGIPLMAPGNVRGMPDPLTDPQYPYDPTRERRQLLEVDAQEQRYGLAYAEAQGHKDNFDPSVVQHNRLYKPGTSVMRNVPHLSGEGAIYTPEYLTKREGNANGAQAFEPGAAVFA